MARKTPIKHIVRSYTRNGKRVSQYVRGSGYEPSKKKTDLLPRYLKPEGRWTEIDDEHWQSNEDDSITVNVNHETLEGWIDEDEDEDAYLVFPARNEKGIPSSPSIFNETNWGSLGEAREEAIKEAKKIMKLPISKIRNFEWSMIDSRGG